MGDWWWLWPADVVGFVLGGFLAGKLSQRYRRRKNRVVVDVDYGRRMSDGAER